MRKITDTTDHEKCSARKRKAKLRTLPLDSIHYEVFAEALQDFRVLSLLERYLHRDKIMDMLDHHSPGGRMTMTEYPQGENAVLSFRKRINKCLAGSVKETS